MMPAPLAAVREAGWIFPEPVWDRLPESEKAFAGLEFTGQRTVDFYRQRLRRIGFAGLESVLDAACGMGQWSTVLAELNGVVQGIDLSAERIAVAQALTASMGRPNCTFGTGALEALPSERNTFEGVFCYGALMFSDMPRTLNEFYRVLKPGGRLYVNANSYGWAAHQFMDRGLRRGDRATIASATRMILRTIRGASSQRFVGRRWLTRQLEQCGFTILAVDTEGHIAHPVNSPPLPAYQPRFYGLPAIIEALAQK